MGRAVSAPDQSRTDQALPLPGQGVRRRAADRPDAVRRAVVDVDLRRLVRVVGKRRGEHARLRRGHVRLHASVRPARDVSPEAVQQISAQGQHDPHRRPRADPDDQKHPAARLTASTSGASGFGRATWFIRFSGGSLSRLGLAVQAAVDAPLPIREHELLRQLALGRGDAARILAPQHAADALGQLERALFLQLAAADDVDRDARIDIADQVPVELHLAVDLDDVLAAELAAGDVFEDGNGAGELVQAEDLVEFHGLAGRDVVDDDPVLNRINKHNVSPPVSRCPAA